MRPIRSAESPTVSEPRNRRRLWWFRLVGPTVALLLLWRLDAREVGAALARIRWPPFVWSLLLVAPLFLVKGWRWRLLLDAHGKRLSLIEALELYTISAGAGALSPGGIGDFLKGFAPAIGSLQIGVWTSALDRVYDIAMLMLLVVVAAVASWPDASRLVLLTLGLLVIGSGIGIRWRTRLTSTFVHLLPTIPDSPHRMGTFLATSAATISVAILSFARFVLLAEALNLRLDLRQQFLTYVVMAGSTALPISIAGLGTRDASLIAFLRSYGVSPAEAIALSSLCLTLILWNGVIAAALWLVRPPQTRK